MHRRPELTVGADHDRGHVEGGEVAVDERAIADGDVIAVVDEQRQLGWVDDWADVPEPVVKIALGCAPASTTQLLDQLRRTMPSGVPKVSTTVIVTCARLSSGLRICARARLITVKASSSSARTSAAVSGALFAAPSVPARIG